MNSHITIDNDGNPAAAADVFDDGAGIQVRFTVEAGHLPVHVRRRLVEAVFELPIMRTTRFVHASIPLGDVDLLNGMRAHCSRVDTRAAGSTCLIDALVEDEDRDR